MPFDPVTLHLLQYQGRRMTAALHPGPGGIPDRKEALLIQRRVDDILDRRPRPVAVAGDGEIVWDSASPFVLGQVLPPAETIAQNATGQAEVVVSEKEIQRILPHGFYGSLDHPDDNDPPEGTASGGVGLLDRP